MVCFVSYDLKIPKNNLEDYIKYVLTPIYGVKREDLKFLDIPDIKSGPWEELRLVQETEEYYKIALRRCTFTTIVNVLPPTIVELGKSFYKDQKVLKDAEEKIDREVGAVKWEVSAERMEVNVSHSELPDLIKQLNMEGVIDRFVEVYYRMDRTHEKESKGEGEKEGDKSEKDEEKELTHEENLKDGRAFICSRGNIPLMIGSFGGKFLVYGLYATIFDVDDGFLVYEQIQGIAGPLDHVSVKNLNKFYEVWKEKGDIKQAVLPPNII